MITCLTEVPIFNRSVFFAGNCTSLEANAAVYDLNGQKTKVEFTPTALGCVTHRSGDIFVWVKDLNQASVVAHELAHAAVSIMDICNIPLCSDTEELMCFLIGWLKINVQDRVYSKWEKQKKRTNKSR
jgi:hypothetical protein